MSERLWDGWHAREKDVRLSMLSPVDEGFWHALGEESEDLASTVWQNDYERMRRKCMTVVHLAQAAASWLDFYGPEDKPIRPWPSAAESDQVREGA